MLQPSDYCHNFYVSLYVLYVHTHTKVSLRRFLKANIVFSGRPGACRWGRPSTRPHGFGVMCVSQLTCPPGNTLSQARATNLLLQSNLCLFLSWAPLRTHWIWHHLENRRKERKGKDCGSDDGEMKKRMNWEIWEIEKESSTELSGGILYSPTWEKQGDMEKWKQGQKMSHALNTPLQWQHCQKHVYSLSVLFLPPFPFLFFYSVDDAQAALFILSTLLHLKPILSPVHTYRNSQDGIRPFIWIDRMLFQLELRQRGTFKALQSLGCGYLCSCMKKRVLNVCNLEPSNQCTLHVMLACLQISHFPPMSTKVTCFQSETWTQAQVTLALTAALFLSLPLSPPSCFSCHS